MEVEIHRYVKFTWERNYKPHIEYTLRQRNGGYAALILSGACAEQAYRFTKNIPKSSRKDIMQDSLEFIWGAWCKSGGMQYLQRLASQNEEFKAEWIKHLIPKLTRKFLNELKHNGYMEPISYSDLKATNWEGAERRWDLQELLISFGGVKHLRTIWHPGWHASCLKHGINIVYHNNPVSVSKVDEGKIANVNPTA